ncbi:glycosyltransferase family 2 protein [Paraburkholderia kururiensis]|uniref:glycosyltransferase family 2 protein n=1 Tax=Paraburkholderia kururiensis TaxID=984307 RepID=UPI0012692B05|nr:hypothetical protein [Paraburkholderia kururiensis]
MTSRIQSINGTPLSKPAHKKVALCIPSHDVVHADFAMALAALTYNPGAALALINPKGSIIPILRNNAVNEAQTFGVDYVLFLDSDMIFPGDTIRRLLAHDKDIVGATYTKRVPPYNILGRTLDDQPLKAAEGLHEVAGLPTGCLLIKMSVFEKLRRPYFRTPHTEEAEGVMPQIQGEDYYFCEAARAAGFKVWLDVDLSARVAHIGQQHFWIPFEEEHGEEQRASV